MNTVKIKDIKNGVIKEVNSSLVNDYIGTGKFMIYNEKKIIDEPSEPKEPTEKKDKNDWFKKTVSKKTEKIENDEYENTNR